jgi:hypothetical protein
MENKKQPLAMRILSKVMAYLVTLIVCSSLASLAVLALKMLWRAIIK